MISLVHASNLRRIAIEFNNLAVQHHKSGDFWSAACVYEDALQVLGEYIRFSRNDRMDGTDGQVLSSWQTKLIYYQKKVFPREEERGYFASGARARHEYQDILEIVQPRKIQTFGSVHSDDEALSVTLLHNTGLLLFQNDRLDLAMTHFCTAVALVADRIDAYVIGSIRLVLGVIYSYQGKDMDSIQQLISAFKISVDCTTEGINLRIATLLRIGHVLLIRGEIDRAVDVFDGALVVRSKNQVEKDSLREMRKRGAPAA